MAAISGRILAGASAVLLGACAPARPATDPGAGALPGTDREVALSRVFVLEAAGAMPDDTMVTVPPGQPRVVVLRRSAPDFGLFARLELGETTLTPPSGGESATLTLRPRPGEYGLDLEVAGAVAGGGTLTFSYGSHFVAPAGAQERYGSDLLFERELRIGHLARDNRVVFLATWRPGSDLLAAAIPARGTGRYLVVAPR